MTASYDWYLPLADELAQRLASPYLEPLDARRQEAGLEWSDIHMSQMAAAAAAGPEGALTLAFLQDRVPYASPESQAEQARGAAQRGLLDEGEDGAWRLSAKGEALIEGLNETVRDALTGLSLPAAEAERAAELLSRQVAGACRDAPCRTPSLDGSRSFDPGPDAPAPLRLRRYLNDLRAYRDDAHVAAWRETGVDGRTWEAFSHVWGEQVWGEPVHSAAEAAEKLGFRGYDQAAYGEALDRAVDEGWLSREGETYELSAAGRALRESVEAETDRNFYAPWHLDEADAAALRGALDALREALREEQEPTAA